MILVYYELEGFDMQLQTIQNIMILMDKYSMYKWNLSNDCVIQR